ncbi:uncharacterized protein LOC132724568 [Ruditapes philippinarum]|uniref:uncharacterized protein LOC132724568 n=1 Tax=Ruditapes philippinarum TaxID=129788 RepID=UPI00295BC3D6|nr:uncharacterized protein LOC132724568 [Ruditapes philippinarum]
MAADILRQYFLEYEHDHKDCTVNMEAACPIIIDFCDASAHSKRFSEATVDFTIGKGLPLAYFFQAGQKELVSYFLEKKEHKSDAIENLKEFIANENHTKCLLSLHQFSQEYSQCHIEVILAAHLFGPLAGRSRFKIGSKYGKAKRCPICYLDVRAAVDNTSLGNGSVWHGDADILVKRSVIKISCDDDLDNGSGEPEKKRIKIGSIGDDDNSTSDESFDSTIEVKRDVISTRAMSQGLAQTIVNAFCEVKKSPSLCNTFNSSFITNESEQYLELKESKFKEHARHKLSVYKESCTKPFTPNEVEKDVDFEIGFRGFCAPNFSYNEIRQKFRHRLSWAQKLGQQPVGA